MFDFLGMLEQYLQISVANLASGQKSFKLGLPAKWTDK